MENIYVFYFLVSVTLFLIIFELVRRKHLREKYAILWFIILFVMIAAFFSQNLIIKISEFIGIKYPPTLVFIVAVIGLLLLNLMLSVIDSHQTDRIIKLAQKIALLEEKINKK